MAASSNCLSPGRFGIRHFKWADRLVCLAPHDTNLKPRAQGDACEGLKRTTSGSKPDKLPLISERVLNKTAAFTAKEMRPGCPSLRAIAKNCYPVPTTRDGKVFRFALHFEQRTGEAARRFE
jgi:hypothetical protein